MSVVSPLRGAVAPATEAGREARFLAFVEAHQDRAVRIAWRLVGGDAAAAEDVAQEAFLRAHRSLDRFREDGSMPAWFFGILVNEARRWRRWRAVRLRWNALWDDGIADPAPAPDGDPALRRRIAAAVDALPAGQREAFVLVHFEGFSVDDAARVLGKAPGTLKSHLNRALVRLRASLGDLAAAPPAPSEVAR